MGDEGLVEQGLIDWLIDMSDRTCRVRNALLRPAEQQSQENVYFTQVRKWSYHGPNRAYSDLQAKESTITAIHTTGRNNLSFAWCERHLRS